MTESCTSPIVCRTCGSVLGACSCGQRSYVLNTDYRGLPGTTEQILRTFATQYRTLMGEIASIKSGSDQNLSLLRLSAQLIAHLPQVIQSAADLASLPPNTLRSISYLGQEAQEAFEWSQQEGRTAFELRTLLLPMGSKTGDPNYLEAIIERQFGKIRE
ncbi:MAG: hypothetical protein WCT01_03010 [Candidatus Shapirobacteria bacterium]